MPNIASSAYSEYARTHSVKSRADFMAGFEAGAAENKNWRLAAEAVLARVQIEGEPAADFIARTQAVGERVARGL
jgi:hypothetical protein